MTFEIYIYFDEISQNLIQHNTSLVQWFKKLVEMAIYEVIQENPIRYEWTNSISKLLLDVHILRFHELSVSVLTRKRGLLMLGVGTLGGGYPYPGCIIGDGGMP